MSSVSIVRRYLMRASGRSQCGGAGLIGTRNADISASFVHDWSSRCACTAWPPRIESDGATIATARRGDEETPEGMRSSTPVQGSGRVFPAQQILEPPILSRPGSQSCKCCCENVSTHPRIGLASSQLMKISSVFAVTYGSLPFWQSACSGAGRVADSAARKSSR